MACACVLLMGCNDNNLHPEKPTLPSSKVELEYMLYGEKSASVKYDILYELACLHLDNNTDAAKKYVGEWYELSKEQDDLLSLSRASFMQGLIYKIEGDYLPAVAYYLEAVDGFEKLNDFNRLAPSLNNLGDVFSTVGNFTYAIKFFESARDLYSNQQDLHKLVLVNINLGICEFSKEEPDYTKAESYFKSAINFIKKLEEQHHTYYLNRVYNQMGTMYYKQKEYANAIFSYQSSLEYLVNSNANEEELAIGYANIAEVYLANNQTKEAFGWINKALDLIEFLDGGQASIDIYNIAGRVYGANNYSNQSIEYLEVAMDMADKEIINESLQETLKLLKAAYDKKRNIGEAVTVTRYANLLDAFAAQESKEHELVEQTNYKALQAALNSTIELESAMKAKQQETGWKRVYSYLAIAALMLALSIAIVLGMRIKKAQLLQAKLDKELKKGLHVLNNWNTYKSN